MRVRSFLRSLFALSLMLAVTLPAAAQVDHFLVEAAGGGSISTQRATNSFPVRITAQKSDNSTETSFTGTVTITSTGTLTAGGGVTASFVAGVLASHAVTIGNTGSFTVTATQGAQSGTSTSFAVIAMASDDFNRHNLDTTRWTFTDPVGDATLTMTGTGTANARLSLAIPQGVRHDLWEGINNAPRLLQAVENSDFVLQAKFESDLSSAYQIQGMLVQQDANRVLRFDLSSSDVNIYVFAASTTDGFTSMPTEQVASTLIGANGIVPIYLRVTRSGDTWTVATSADGTSFTDRGSFSFAMTVTQAGLFIGNAGPALPGFTMLADYFYDNALPVAPEDGGTVTDVFPPYLYDLSTLAGGSAIRVTWKTDERSKSRIEYGTTTGYGSSVLDDTLRTTHTMQLSGLSSSTPYHFRVIMWDSLDQRDTTIDIERSTTVPAPPSVAIWNGATQSFGSIGTPQRWVNIHGNATDVAGIDSLYYRLNGGDPVMLSRGPDLRRLQNTGDFNIDLGYASLNAGPNTVSLRARSVFGDVLDTAITVNDNSGSVWPLPYSVSWGSSTSLKDSVQIVDGKWELVSGKARATERGYDRCFAIGDTTWQDYEVTTKLTVHGYDSTSKAFDAPSSGPAVGIIMRWTGHSTNPIAGQPLAGYLPLGAVGWVHWTSVGSSRWELLGNNLTEEVLSSPSGFALGTTYYFKMQVRTIAGQGGYYRFKYWDALQPEPAGWLLSAQEGLSDPQFGSVLIVAHHVTVDIADVRIAELPVDVTGPIVSGMTSEAGPTSVYISWTTDEPANRRVAYGLTSSYTDTVTVSGALGLAHGVAIAGLNPSTIYHFRALSTDADGNTGTSNDSTFTTGAPAVPTTLASDEFNSPGLNGMWTFTAPVGDESYAMPGTELQIVVPAGAEHDLWTSGYHVPRAMQSVNNTDFEVEVKWNSGIAGTATQYRIQGIVVEQDENDLIRFDFTSKPTDIRVYAAVFRNGFAFDSIGVKLDSTLVGAAGVAPNWLRVKREGNVWSQWYSLDGTTWNLVARFHHAVTVTKVGVFAGNAGTAPPAHTGIVDYFRADGVTVNMKAFLQGPYVAAGDSMKTSLAAYLPQKNPYSGTPWNYAGGDSVASIPSGVVDWVLVTLRSGTASTTGVDTVAAFIKKDGSVVGLDGTSVVQFSGVKFGNYYVVLTHRNHLRVMTADALALNGTTSLYDMTTAMSKAYTTGADPMKLVGSRYTLFGGDGNGSNGVNATDRNAVWRVQNGLINGYYSGDFNLDARVNATDQNAIWRINNGFLSRVP